MRATPPEVAGLRRIPGLIAEEVAEACPVFAIYEGDELSGVAYDRLAAGLLVVVKDQAAKVASLEERLSAIESKV